MWVGKEALRVKFHRLYRISGNQEGKINEIGRWKGEEWDWKLSWKISLRASKESSLNNLLQCVNRYTLDRTKEEIWS